VLGERMNGRLPVVFSAHGSPMNAAAGNAFTRFLGGWSASLGAPRAILVVSAHWQTRHLAVTAGERPQTVHDFYGFPAELYALNYPAPGSPDLAVRVAELLSAAGHPVKLDPERGLDHGAWSPLLRIFPKAEIPVVELSLLHAVAPIRHVEIGRALAPLRSEGVLIFGSGNVVHNLGTADMTRENRPVAPWAAEFDGWVRSSLDRWDLDALAAFQETAPNGRLAHPTIEHYVPLLVAAGAAEGAPRAGSERAHPRVTYPYEGFEHGTLSMRCVAFE
jgi:4,5-DOPA dioxygenase extradiol